VKDSLSATSAFPISLRNPLRTIGIGLLAFSLMVAWQAWSRPYRHGSAQTIIAVNALWVIGSIVASVAGALGLSPIGRVWALLQGLVVAGLTMAQLIASRHTT
jgi:hypothetical protein